MFYHKYQKLLYSVSAPVFNDYPVKVKLFCKDQ